MEYTSIIGEQELNVLAEGIAESMHDAWARQRIAEGWTYGVERNTSEKVTPMLVPFSALPESEKVHNLNVANEALKYIISAGYKIVK